MQTKKILCQAITTIIVCIAIVAVLSTLVLRVTIASQGEISISLTTNNQQVEEPLLTYYDEPMPGENYTISEMQIKFNPSGIHIHNGYLKVRFDIYTSENSKCHSKYWVWVPAFPNPYDPFEGYQGKMVEDEMGFLVPADWDDYNKWVETLPGIFELNPCLCIFVRVDEETTDKTLSDWLNLNINEETIKQLDDIQYATESTESAHLISALFHDKRGFGKRDDTRSELTKVEVESLKTVLTTRFNNIEITKPYLIEESLSFPEPRSIDVGSDAIDRTSYSGFVNNGTGRTKLDLNNSANAIGSLDTIEVWFYVSATTDVIGGTFYFLSGTDYKCRDSETLGTVASGSKVSFTSLDIDVSTGDNIGVFSTTGSIERTTAGEGGYANYNAEAIDPGDEATYSVSADDAISLYGTGEEGGGVPAITNTQSTWAIGVVDVDDIVYFSATGSQDDDYSQIENTGDVAVDVEIQGADVEGGDYDWTLASSTSTEQYSLYANSGNGTSTYNIEVKSSAYNDLTTSLAVDAVYNWSMKFTAPTAFNANDDGEQKSATVTLVASEAS